MTKQKQTNNKTGAVLTREIPEQDRLQIAIKTGQQGRNSRPARVIIPGHGGT